MDQDLDDVAFSRTGITNPIGKLDTWLDGFRFNSEAKDRLQRMATEAEMPLSEFCRLVLECKAFGPEHVASLYAKRVDRAKIIVG